MPVPVVEQKAGSCYVWVIATVLFLSLAAGGTLLGMYLFNPGSSSVSSYPVIGISLICLPWLFWFITILYRFLSRKLGFHMVFCGASIDSLPRSPTAAINPGGGGKETMSSS